MFLLLFRWTWGLRTQATARKKIPLSLFSLLLGGSVQVGRQNEKCWCLFLGRTSRAQIASALKGRSPDSSQYISEPGSSWDVHLGESWSWRAFHPPPGVIQARFLRDPNRHGCLPMMLSLSDLHFHTGSLSHMLKGMVALAQMWPFKSKNLPALLPGWSLSPCLWKRWPTAA